MGSDVLLGHDGSTPVYLRDDHRTAHVAILGKSRFGKTTLLEHLVLNDIRSGTAAIVIDAHGDLSKRLVGLAPLGKASAGDASGIVLVEPNTQRSFGLNLYECPDPTDARQVTTTIGSVVEIFRKLMGSEGTGYLPLIESGLRNTARVLIANSLTMREIPLLYYDDVFRSRALTALPTRTDYWQEYEASTSQRQQDKREPVLNKVARFLEDDLIAPMVSQPHTTIPFKSVMDKGGTLLLNLARLDRETVSFLGMVFLSVLSNLIHQREKILPAHRKRVHLYLDEYGRFATPTTKRLLEEGGKYGLGVTIAHQNLRQTPEYEALDVQTLISFQIGAEDAFKVAGSFDCTPIRTKRVARQRMEPQYREWEEDVWDSTESQRQYEELREKADRAESEYETAAKFQESHSRHILKGLYGEGTEGRGVFQSSDGTVHGVFLLKRLRDDRRFPRNLRYQLQEIFERLYTRFGRVPTWEEAIEAHEWRHHTATLHEQTEQRLREILPEKRKHYIDLKERADRFYRKHASLEWQKEYVGETSVKSGRRPIYDHIEEIDQSHADRQAEIANTLTQLPRYVACCKVFGSDGKSHEYRVEVPPPAKFDAKQKQPQKTPIQLERALKIEKKLRGAEPLTLDEFGSWSPETGFTFQQKEFQEAMTRFMQDLRHDVQLIEPEHSFERRIDDVRVWSREQFGTTRDDIEKEIRERQMRPPQDDGQPSQPVAPKPQGPSSPPKQKTIGRRSPKRG